MRSTPAKTRYDILSESRRLVVHSSRVLAYRLPAPSTPHWYTVGVDVPFENGWEQYTPAAGANLVQFMMDDSGFVRLRGMMSNFTSAVHLRAFILPMDFRPPRLEEHPVRWSDLGSNPSDFATAVPMYIHADGRVDFGLDGSNFSQFSGAVEVPWLTIDSHRFRAA
jgi:hypothetical protein